jgi:hypothetical protein
MMTAAYRPLVRALSANKRHTSGAIIEPNCKHEEEGDYGRSGVAPSSSAPGDAAAPG